MPRPRTISDTAILAATGRAVARQGIARVTLATVAAETGLSPATLVQRFGSKRRLLLAYASAAEPGARRTFDQARERHDSALAALHTALASLAAGIHHREELAGSLTFLQLDLTDDEFHKHAKAHTLAVRREITALLAEAVSTGELTAGTDCARLAMAVQVAYNGTLIVWALTGEDALPDMLGTMLGETLRPHLG